MKNVPSGGKYNIKTFLSQRYGSLMQTLEVKTL